MSVILSQRVLRLFRWSHETGAHLKQTALRDALILLQSGSSDIIPDYDWNKPHTSYGIDSNGAISRGSYIVKPDGTTEEPEPEPEELVSDSEAFDFSASTILGQTVKDACAAIKEIRNTTWLDSLQDFETSRVGKNRMNILAEIERQRNKIAKEFFKK
jgi:hypothetical protein